MTPSKGANFLEKKNKLESLVSRFPQKRNSVIPGAEEEDPPPKKEFEVKIEPEDVPPRPKEPKIEIDEFAVTTTLIEPKEEPFDDYGEQFATDDLAFRYLNYDSFLPENPPKIEIEPPDDVDFKTDILEYGDYQIEEIPTKNQEEDYWKNPRNKHTYSLREHPKVKNYPEYLSGENMETIDNSSQPSTSSEAYRTEYIVESEEILVPPTTGGRRCTLCFNVQHLGNTRTVSVKNDTMVLLVPRVLQGHISIDQAKHMLKKRTHVVCRNHFKDTVDTLCTYLSIESSDQFSSAPPELLVNIVNELCPDVGYEGFQNLIHKFDVKNRKVKEVVRIENIPKVKSNRGRKPKEKTEKPPKMDHYCSLCSKGQELPAMQEVPNANHVLVIIVGCIIRQKYTIAQAQIFLQLVEKCYICHVHFAEASKEICKYFEIGGLMDINSCKLELLTELMPIVKSLFPAYTSAKFQLTVGSFYEQYKGIIEGFITENVKVEPPEESEKPDTTAYKTGISEVLELQKKGFCTLTNPNDAYLMTVQKYKHGIYIDFTQCTLCLKLKSRTELRKVCNGDRLVISVGYVLLEKFTVTQIQTRMHKKENIVCHSHFADAFQAILNNLNVDSIVDVPKSPIDRKEHVMTTVSALSSSSQNSHNAFFSILDKFYAQNADIVSIE
ncbi:hypothetical protein GCK72_004285 [Caenorhabditis remanei]|uniref:Lin-15A/B-like domain-containing protein n=1 Tax=Caenorhabditis remanei TaxID=31234 RepID=A0A6A5H9C5_CAERE|nr:hypothetical protein GCK72_004285 [Caenorhabditis remanei]KAF1764338.1 hypothetical protein GCK72_004285 [Caenorhabditis remanei]